jgi:hypothetical protein
MLKMYECLKKNGVHFESSTRDILSYIGCDPGRKILPNSRRGRFSHNFVRKGLFEKKNGVHFESSTCDNILGVIQAEKFDKQPSST